jgi:hypothetical protein
MSTSAPPPQYSANNPVESLVRLCQTVRAVFIDGKTAWILTQSLKDFAKKSPAETVRADDTADLKIRAYEAVWNSAKVVV